MNDRTGQVWRKSNSEKDRRSCDIIVLQSVCEARRMGAKTEVELTKGTNHVIVRYYFKDAVFKTETWYEPDNDKWEKKPFFTRVL